MSHTLQNSCTGRSAGFEPCGVLNLFKPRRSDWKANIVVWVVTVAVFLGTLVGGVLILFLFSQRDLIREALRDPEKKRMERRTVARVEVELLSTDAPS